MPKTPPRYVPTLTQIVQPPTPGAASQNAVPAQSEAEKLSPEPIQQMPHTVEQQLHQQLLLSTRHYLDVELQKRIRETVSQLALEHAHKLFEEIQPILESTISQVVQEAVERAVKQAAKDGT